MSNEVKESATTKAKPAVVAGADGVVHAAAVVPARRRCFPKQGQHPGELHEALTSWIDERTQSVRLTVRHVPTGEVSEVDLFQTRFGGGAA